VALLAARALAAPPIHKQKQPQTLQMFKPNLLGKRKRFKGRCLTFKEKDKSLFAKLGSLDKIG
jgi:hypothetical protein